MHELEGNEQGKLHIETSQLSTWSSTSDLLITKIFPLFFVKRLRWQLIRKLQALWNDESKTHLTCHRYLIEKFIFHGTFGTSKHRQRLWNVCAILTSAPLKVFTMHSSENHSSSKTIEKQRRSQHWTWRDSFRRSHSHGYNDSFSELIYFDDNFIFLWERRFNLQELNWRNSIFQQSASFASAQFHSSVSIAFGVKSFDVVEG